MKPLLCLLLVGMLVACDEDSSNSNDSSSTDDPQCSSYNLSISDVKKPVDYNSKLTIAIEVHDDGELTKDSNEITLAITCGEHKVVDKKQKTTDGKATFADIAVSGDNFANKCSIKATTDVCDLTDESDFAVAIPTTAPPNTSLPSSVELKEPPKELTIGSITVGQPIDITIPTSFSGGVKIQPRFTADDKENFTQEDEDEDSKPCDGYFLIHHDGNQLTQVLTSGVVITAENGKLNGLVLIKKTSAPSCNHKLVLATTLESYTKTFIGENPSFDGNLVSENVNNENKLALAGYSGTPEAIFFTTAGEGNLWTKGVISSRSTVSTLDYNSSGNAALVKSDRGSWSHIGN